MPIDGQPLSIVQDLEEMCRQYIKVRPSSSTLQLQHRHSTGSTPGSACSWRGCSRNTCTCEHNHITAWTLTGMAAAACAASKHEQH